MHDPPQQNTDPIQAPKPCEQIQKLYETTFEKRWAHKAQQQHVKTKTTHTNLLNG